MGKKSPKVAARILAEGNEYCPICHFPFCGLKIIEPASHVDKCMQRKSAPKKECPEGIDCASSMVTHYQLYSHKTLAEYHKDPGSISSTPKHSKSIDELFSSLSGCTASSSTKKVKRSSSNDGFKVKSEDDVLVDLTESTTSSQEYSQFETQDKPKTKTCLSQSTLKFVSSRQRSGIGQNISKSGPSVNKKTGITEKQQNQKIPPHKNCTTGDSKKQKVMAKVRGKKSMLENPWTISASQIGKLPKHSRKRLYSGKSKESKIIDLTLDDTPAKIKREKQQNVEKIARTSWHPSFEPNRVEEMVDGIFRIPDQDSSVEVHPQNKKNKDSHKHVEKKTFHNQSQEIQIQSTQKCSSTSKSSLINSQETQDSEEWPTVLPMGPGFTPVTPIPIEKNSSTFERPMMSDEDDDYFSAHSDPDLPNRQNFKQSKDQNPDGKKKTILTFDKNSNFTHKDRILNCSSEKMMSRENEFSDEESEDEQNDISLLQGISDSMELPSLIKTNAKNGWDSQAMASEKISSPTVLPVDPNLKLPSNVNQKPPSNDSVPMKTPFVNVKREVASTTERQSTIPYDNKVQHHPIRVNGRSKQGDIGSMLFGLKPKVEKPKDTLEFPRPKRSNTFKNGGTNSSRSCPFYKKVAETNIAVDAFSYNTIEGIEFYFLSHFHYDHYMGLTKKHWKHRIYCSEVTGNLVAQKIGLPQDLIIRLPMYEEIEIGSVRVILLEANHCPGAVLFLFKLRNNRTVLHTGDFRAHPDMENYSALRDIKVHTLYLDTTYLNPNYRFPWQSDVIDTAVSIATSAVKHNPKTLIVVGSYTIGKERIFAAIAKALKSSVLVTAEKFRTINCLVDQELERIVTKKPDGAGVHVVAMKSLNVRDLKEILKRHSDFTSITAIKPTGWTHNNEQPDMEEIKPIVSGPIKIYGVPYSEHSSFEDLRRFVKFLKPAKIIPTVNVGKKESRDMMDKFLVKWKFGKDP